MRVSGVLIDIDGVLTVSWRPLPGAVAALRQLFPTQYRDTPTMVAAAQ